MKLATLILLLALLAVVQPAGVQAGEPAPDFSLSKLEGGSLSLSSLRGKVVVLNFFRTFCPHCVREVPELNDLHRRLGSLGVEVLGMGLDRPDRLKSYAALNKVGYTILLCSEEVRRAYGEIPGTMGLRGVPTTVIIGPAGDVRRVFLGRADQAELERQVRELLPTT
jgi:peroxiredoxin